MATASALLAVAAASPARRAWLRFKRNRLGYWSLVAFCVMVVLSLGAELISNDRPLVVRYEGQTYWPLWNDYPEKTFGEISRQPRTTWIPSSAIACARAATGRCSRSIPTGRRP